MKLQGHLTDYPLRDLLTIFIKRRETGQLLIDFESAPGIFYFKEGKLISSRLGPLEGFSAVNRAFSLAESSFCFDSHAPAPEVTISDLSRELIMSRLLGIHVNDLGECDFVNRRPVPSRPPRSIETHYGRRRALTTLWPVSDHKRRLLLTAKGTLTYVHRHALAASAAVILLLMVPAVIAITVRLGRYDGRPEREVIAQMAAHLPGNPTNSVRTGSDQGNISMSTGDHPGYTGEKPTAGKSPVAKLKTTSSPPAPAENASDQEPTLRNDKDPPENSSKVIAVVMRIEDGRVSEAYVKEHHPGLEAYEATAIRLARQRRYSKDKAGTETIVVKVSGDQK